MTEEKRARLMAAVTVNVILLIAILAAVLVYQLVVLTTLRTERKRITVEIERYEQMVQESDDYLERLQSEEYLRDKLIEYGWHYAD